MFYSKLRITHDCPLSSEKQNKTTKEQQKQNKTKQNTKTKQNHHTNRHKQTNEQKKQVERVLIKENKKGVHSHQVRFIRDNVKISVHCSQPKSWSIRSIAKRTRNP